MIVPCQNRIQLFFTHIPFIYAAISMPRILLKAEFGFFDTQSLIFELLFGVIAILIGFSSCWLPIKRLGNFQSLLICLFFSLFGVLVFRSDLDSLERILYAAAFFLYLKHSQFRFFGICLFLNAVIVIYGVDLSRPGLYGNNLVQGVMVGLAQNLPFFLCLVPLLVRVSQLAVLFWGSLALVFEFILLSFANISTFHQEYQSLNAIELLFAKFFVRADWIWTIGDLNLLRSQMEFKYTNIEIFSRFLSFFRWPLEYFFQIVLWKPVEFGRDLATHFRGTWSAFNIDAASWASMVTYVSLDATLILVLSSLVFLCLLLPMLLQSFSATTDAGLRSFFIFASFLIYPTIAYQGRDLKTIIWFIFFYSGFSLLAVLLSPFRRRSVG